MTAFKDIFANVFFFNIIIRANLTIVIVIVILPMLSFQMDLKNNRSHYPCLVYIGHLTIFAIISLMKCSGIFAKIILSISSELHRVQDLLIIVNITTVVLNLWGAPPQLGATLSQRGRIAVSKILFWKLKQNVKKKH